MKSLHVATLFAACALVLAACRTSREQSDPPPPPSPAPETPISFRASTDTVATTHPEGEGTAESQNGNRDIRFMVQIGAFQNPANASVVQRLARERYHKPVLNDYHTGLKLYQVRIGFFEDYQSASGFRSQMIQEHPSDYRDAWIVQLKR